MGIIWTIVIGFVAGVIAKFIMMFNTPMPEKNASFMSRICRSSAYRR